MVHHSRDQDDLRTVDRGEVDGWLEQLAVGVSDWLDTQVDDNYQVVGIHTGGVWVATWLLHRLELDHLELGELNIAFYRDDFSRIGIHPTVSPSNLPFDIDERRILLVDDILFTGRTIRAALNELFDYGRPSSVTLAVLVDRGGRELPIQPDIVGTTMDLGTELHVKLRKAEPIEIVLQQPRG